MIESFESFLQSESVDENTFFNEIVATSDSYHPEDLNPQDL